nr:hypothetical protein [Tanacetum cinerariifolium]
EYAPSVHQQSEFSQPDTRIVVPVFQKGDDPIDAINHMISFLMAVVTLRYPPTNNQLRTSSNPRQQATINNERVTIQPIQRRQNSLTAVEYAPSVHQQSEFSQPDTRIVVSVFQKGDDPIDAINHMISFLVAVVTLRYPPTNNQLRISSNPRQQATINNGRVTIQPIQRRQNSLTAGMSRQYTSGPSQDNYKKMNAKIKKSSIELPDDLDMPKLEDINIFEDSNEDVFCTEADLNNLESIFQVSHIPNTRIHKDHPLEQVIRDL